MTGRVLANAGVFALGVILIVGGAWAIWHGSDYVQLEWGWTSVISGAIAVTGGVLTLATGVVLTRLDSLQRTLLGLGAIAVPQPAATAIAPEQIMEPMPLGLAPAAAAPPEPQAAFHEPPPAAREAQPEAVEPAPQQAIVDPAAAAAAAINLELLDHEEREASGAHAEPPAAPEPVSHETAPAEPPREIVHVADQGPADDMVKAAGVSDEPELDAAIEQLLAEERARGAPAHQSPPAATETSPAAFDEPAAAQQPSPASIEEPGPEKARGARWRGLFSRQERRNPAADLTRTGPALEHPPDTASGEPEFHSELEPGPGEQTPVAADAIPRTGDDWFDRALSGVDEVGTPYEPSGNADPEETRPGPELHTANAADSPPAVPPSAEPAVIGRYTSGNTTYVMFADGSIEAETPSGILHFASLADLKIYVEGGGS
jgi:hypothetical protein